MDQVNNNEMSEVLRFPILSVYAGELEMGGNRRHNNGGKTKYLVIHNAWHNTDHCISPKYTQTSLVLC